MIQGGFCLSIRIDKVWYTSFRMFNIQFLFFLDGLLHKQAELYRLQQAQDIPFLSIFSLYILFRPPYT